VFHACRRLLASCPSTRACATHTSTHSWRQRGAMGEVAAAAAVAAAAQRGAAGRRAAGAEQRQQQQQLWRSTQRPRPQPSIGRPKQQQQQ
jgi:hypothetical protein